MKIILFGTGAIYRRYKSFFIDEHVICLMDNNLQKANKILDGIEIKSPKDIKDISYDVIFILTKYFNEIKEQLISIGVNEDLIFTYEDIRNNIEPFELKKIRYIGDMPSVISKKILIVLHNMNITGANIVIREAIKIIKKHGWNIIIASPVDGCMSSVFALYGMVIIDRWLSFARLTCIPWMNEIKPRLIIVNTVWLHNLFKCANNHPPVIWWLHDSEALYSCNHIAYLNKYNHDNIKAYAVSSIAQIPFITRCPKWPVELLPYGIEDTIIKRIYTDKFVFALIGSLEEHKGQDIFIEAINLIPTVERRTCEFWLIYQNTRQSEYMNKIKKEAGSILEMKLLGEIDPEDMKKVYQNISVVVCPSRSDTLPTVTVEAMQNGIPCIVSDGTGTANYVEDFSNGFVCPKGDATALADKILWMIHNKDKIPSMGIKARKTYENNFTLDVFEKKLLGVIGQFDNFSRRQI